MESCRRGRDGVATRSSMHYIGPEHLRRAACGEPAFRLDIGGGRVDLPCMTMDMILHQPNGDSVTYFGCMAIDVLASGERRPYRSGRKLLLRIGEATNPGPRAQGGQGGRSTIKVGAAEYRCPAQTGFRHSVLPSPLGARGNQDRCHFELVIDTINGTAWGPISRHLQNTQAQLLLCQEHHLGPADAAAASAYALRQGWQPLILPAAPGEGGGWRGGVAILARSPLRLLPPRVGPYEIVPARAMAAVVEAPGYRAFTAVSIYLEHGKSIGPENMAHLQEVGLFLDAQGERVPFVAGGDFQADPEDAARLGFARRTGSSLVAARDPRGTCRSTTSVSEIDFFYVHDVMTAGLAEVTVVEGAGTAPHVPVRLRFHPRQTSARALTLRRPPRIGVERIIGPLPKEPTWGDVAEASAKLLARVRDKGFNADEAFRQDYSQLFTSWADAAEQEVIEATGSRSEVKKVGLRGRPPLLVWRAVQPERAPPPPPHVIELTRWRTWLTILQELRGTIQWMLPVAPATLAAGYQGSASRPEPVPQHLRGDTLPHLTAKLQSIRAQLDDHCPFDDADAPILSGDPNGDEVDEQMEHEDAIRGLRALVAAVEIEICGPTSHSTSPAWSGTSSTVLDHLIAAADVLLDRIQRRLKKAAAGERAARIDGWRQWISHNLHNGARNAHKYLRIPTEWRPTTTLTIDGVITADPQCLLAAYAAKYDNLWNSAARARGSHQQSRGEARCSEAQTGDGQGGNSRAADAPWKVGRSDPLPRPTPQDIRDAANSFSKTTVVAYDGMALRHYAMLSDEGLYIIADIIEIAETVGGLPSQLDLTEMPMIAKPRGGHRAVATLVSIYRLWAKLRKPYVTAWEVSHDRPYLTAGKGKTPQATVWRQASRAEAAVAKGRHAGTLLWDVKSFFEAVKRLPLWHRARKLQFPLPILRIALSMYGSARVLTLGGALSAPMDAQDGILAGCGFAMALTRAYVVEPMDVAVASIGPATPLPATADMFVDDLAVTAEGTMREVVDRLSNAADVLQAVIEGPMDCQIELEKAAVISSHPALTSMLMNRFGERAGPQARAHQLQARGRRRAQGSRGGRPRPRGGLGRTIPRSRLNAVAVNLGIDCTAGQARRVQNKNSKRAARFVTLKRKTARLRRISSVTGKRTPYIFCAGPLPEAVYGAAVNGLSDAEVLTLRRCAAQAYTPRARGRSLSRLLLIEGVPTWRAEVEVVLEYSRQVWAASLRGAEAVDDGSMTLAEISRLWHAISTEDILPRNGQCRAWAEAKGPIGAAWLSLHRIGWSMRGPFTLRDHNGEDLILTTTTPALLATLLKQAVTRTLQLQVGEKLSAQDPTFQGRRAAAEHIASQLRGDRKLTCKDRACYMSVACGAIMTFARAAAAGYLVENKCPLCGARGDTIIHRVWRCQHPDAVAAREAAVPQWIIQEFQRAADPEHSTFWQTGIIPHPADIWPAPCSTAEMTYEWIGDDAPGDGDRHPDGRPMLHGSLYVDGSCTTGVFAELRRAAVSIVQWEARRPAGWRMQMPIPRPIPQTPQAAEYGALTLVARYVHPTRAASVASDCANVVRDAQAPPKVVMTGKRAYAGLIKEVLTDNAWRRRVVVRKVPAHVKPETLPQGQARDDATGNEMADVLAKEARAGHPMVPPAMEQDLAAAMRRARHVVRAIAKVSQCFPPMPRERMVRPPPAREGARVGVGDGHRWHFAGGLWRCEACLRMTTKATISGCLAHQKCPGTRPSMDAAALTAKGHTMAQTGGMVPILFCVKCGAWSTRRAFGLAARCRGRPAPAGRQALARILRGLQPWEDHREGQGAGRRGIASCEKMWSSGAGGFIQRAASGTRGAARKRPLPPCRGAEGDDITVHEPPTAARRRLEHGDGPFDDDARQTAAPTDAAGLELAHGHDDEDVFGHGGSLDQRADLEHVASRPIAAETPMFVSGPPSGSLHASDFDGSSARGSIEMVEPCSQEACQRLTGDGWPREQPNGAEECGVGAITAQLNEDDANMKCDGGRDAELGGAHESLGRGRKRKQGAAGEQERQQRVEAIGASFCVVVAREGPGDPEPSASTATAAGQSSAPAAVAVALAEDAILLSSGDSIAGPPDGAAAPSDDSRPGAIIPHGRVLHLNPQAMPDVEGGGGPRARSMDSPQEARRRRRAGLRTGDVELPAARDTPPAGSTERRRVGNGDPASCSLVARCGSVATGAAGSDQSQWGCHDRTGKTARNGCGQAAQISELAQEGGGQGNSGVAAQAGEATVYQAVTTTDDGDVVGAATSSSAAASLSSLPLATAGGVATAATAYGGGARRSCQEQDEVRIKDGSLGSGAAASNTGDVSDAAHRDHGGGAAMDQRRRPAEVPRGPRDQGYDRGAAHRLLGGPHRPLHGDAGGHGERRRVQGAHSADPRRRPIPDGDDHVGVAGHGRKRGPPVRLPSAAQRRRRLDAPGAGGTCCDQSSQHEDGHPRLPSGTASVPTLSPVSAWVMPWERRPSWEYLPHLNHSHLLCRVGAAVNITDVTGADYAADENGVGGNPDGADAHASSGHALDGASGSHDQGAVRRHGAAGSMHAGQSLLDDGRVREAANEIRGRTTPPGGRFSSPAATAGIGGTALIRGQGRLPGPADGGSGAVSSAGRACPLEQTCQHGPSGDGNVSKAQEKLDRQNAVFARSFADHAERVAAKSRTGRHRDEGSAAERLAALRQRVRQRMLEVREGHGDTVDAPLQGPRDQLTGEVMMPVNDRVVAPGGPGDAGDQGELDRRVWTIEVPKMHLTHSVESVQGRDGHRHGGGGHEFVEGVDSMNSAARNIRTSAAAEASASHVAWHSGVDYNGPAPH